MRATAIRVDTSAEPVVGSVLIVSHTSDLAGPTEALVRYLTGAARQLTVVLNPLEYCVSQRRQASIIENGSIRREFTPPNLRLPALANWILDVAVALYYSVRAGRRYDVFIGCNCLNAVIGCWLRSLGIVRRVVFYAIDWTPTIMTFLVFFQVSTTAIASAIVRVMGFSQ